jgi:hypothetical protein
MFTLFFDIIFLFFYSSYKKTNGPSNPLLTREWTIVEFVENLNRSTNIITKNIEYKIDPQSKIEETTLYYYQTLEVGQHHTMDPLMFTCLFEGAFSNIELQLTIQ